MKIGIVGQKWLASKLLAQTAPAHHVVFAAAPADNDRLAQAARAFNVPVYCAGEPCWQEKCALHSPDLLVCAHATVKIGPTLLRASWNAIGYHPSLLPLYRGLDAINAALDDGQKITGGTVYHLDNGFDTGAVAYSDWVFIRPGDDALSLWKDLLGPLGLELLGRAIDHFACYGFIPAERQEERRLSGFASKK